MSILDIGPIVERYDTLLAEITPFLVYETLPLTKSHLIAYINKCSKHEASLISLKSELLMVKSELNRDYRALYRKTHKSLGLGQKWEAKLNVEMDPSVSDMKMSLDKTESMIEVLNDIRWSLKSNRDVAKSFTLHVD